MSVPLLQEDSLHFFLILWPSVAYNSWNCACSGRGGGETLRFEFLIYKITQVSDSFPLNFQGNCCCFHSSWSHYAYFTVLHHCNTLCLIGDPLRNTVSQNLRATHCRVMLGRLLILLVKYRIWCTVASILRYAMNLSGQSWTPHYQSGHVTSCCASCINQTAHYAVRHVILVDASTLTFEYSLSVAHPVVLSVLIKQRFIPCIKWSLINTAVSAQAYRPLGLG
jgi:hypothetical protein